MSSPDPSAPVRVRRGAPGDARTGLSAGRARRDTVPRVFRRHLGGPARVAEPAVHGGQRRRRSARAGPRFAGRTPRLGARLASGGDRDDPHDPDCNVAGPVSLAGLDRSWPRWSRPTGSSPSGSGGVSAMPPALACRSCGSARRSSWIAFAKGPGSLVPMTTAAELPVDAIQRHLEAMFGAGRDVPRRPAGGDRRRRARRLTGPSSSSARAGARASSTGSPPGCFGTPAMARP